MCLNKIELASPSWEGPYLDDKLTLPEYGWKVVYNNKPLLWPQKVQGPLSSNKWTTEIGKYNIEGFDDNDLSIGEYPSGFHIFLNVTDAERFRFLWMCPWGKIKKVLFKNIVAIGKESYYKGDIVVARKIKMAS